MTTLAAMQQALVGAAELAFTDLLADPVGSLARAEGALTAVLGV